MRYSTVYVIDRLGSFLEPIKIAPLEVFDNQRRCDQPTSNDGRNRVRQQRRQCRCQRAAKHARRAEEPGSQRAADAASTPGKAAPLMIAVSDAQPATSDGRIPSNPPKAKTMGPIAAATAASTTNVNLTALGNASNLFQSFSINALAVSSAGPATTNKLLPT